MNQSGRQQPQQPQQQYVQMSSQGGMMQAQNVQHQQQWNQQQQQMQQQRQMNPQPQMRQQGHMQQMDQGGMVPARMVHMAPQQQQQMMQQNPHQGMPSMQSRQSMQMNPSQQQQMQMRDGRIVSYGPNGGVMQHQSQQQPTYVMRGSANQPMQQQMQMRVGQDPRTIRISGGDVSMQHQGMDPRQQERPQMNPEVVRRKVLNHLREIFKQRNLQAIGDKNPEIIESDLWAKHGAHGNYLLAARQLAEKITTSFPNPSAPPSQMRQQAPMQIPNQRAMSQQAQIGSRAMTPMGGGTMQQVTATQQMNSPSPLDSLQRMTEPHSRQQMAMRGAPNPQELMMNQQRMEHQRMQGMQPGAGPYPSHTVQMNMQQQQQMQSQSQQQRYQMQNPSSQYPLATSPRMQNVPQQYRQTLHPGAVRSPVTNMPRVASPSNAKLNMTNSQPTSMLIRVQNPDGSFRTEPANSNSINAIRMEHMQQQQQQQSHNNENVKEDEYNAKIQDLVNKYLPYLNQRLQNDAPTADKQPSQEYKKLQKLQQILLGKERVADISVLDRCDKALAQMIVKQQATDEKTATQESIAEDSNKESQQTNAEDKILKDDDIFASLSGERVKLQPGNIGRQISETFSQVFDNPSALDEAEKKALESVLQGPDLDNFAIKAPRIPIVLGDATYS